MTDRYHQTGSPARHRARLSGTFAALLILGGCADGRSTHTVARLLEPEQIAVRASGPPDATPGTCWTREYLPAVVETETIQVQVPPNRPDRSTVPTVYRTETRQRILRERQEIWFQTPCPDRMTTAFIASVQRALSARDLYHGPISGTFDARTRAAIRRYQAPQGLDSGTLSVTAARQLGLVPVDLPTTPG